MRWGIGSLMRRSLISALGKINIHLILGARSCWSNQVSSESCCSFAGWKDLHRPAQCTVSKTCQPSLTADWPFGSHHPFFHYLAWYLTTSLGSQHTNSTGREYMLDRSPVQHTCFCLFFTTAPCWHWALCVKAPSCVQEIQYSGLCSLLFIDPHRHVKLFFLPSFSCFAAASMKSNVACMLSTCLQR